MGSVDLLGIGKIVAVGALLQIFQQSPHGSAAVLLGFSRKNQWEKRRLEMVEGWGLLPPAQWISQALSGFTAR